MQPLTLVCRLAIVLSLAVVIGGADSAPSALAPTAATQPESVGDPDHGFDLIQRVGCGSCHSIPGVPMADGLVGPPLDRMGSREYIAGMLHNTPDNMVTWLRFPQKVVPGNAMPDMGLSDAEARDIAAYLYTLR